MLRIGIVLTLVEYNMVAGGIGLCLNGTSRGRRCRSGMDAHLPETMAHALFKKILRIRRQWHTRIRQSLNEWGRADALRVFFFLTLNLFFLPALGAGPLNGWCGYDLGMKKALCRRFHLHYLLRNALCFNLRAVAGLTDGKGRSLRCKKWPGRRSLNSRRAYLILLM